MEEALRFNLLSLAELLESNKYEQEIYHYRSGNKFCALGVEMDRRDKDGWINLDTSAPSHRLCLALLFNEDIDAQIVYMNDILKLSFKNIATILRSFCKENGETSLIQIARREFPLNIPATTENPCG